MDALEEEEYEESEIDTVTFTNIRTEPCLDQLVSLAITVKAPMSQNVQTIQKDGKYVWDQSRELTFYDIADFEGKVKDFRRAFVDRCRLR